MAKTMGFGFGAIEINEERFARALRAAFAEDNPNVGELAAEHVDGVLWDVLTSVAEEIRESLRHRAQGYLEEWHEEELSLAEKADNELFVASMHPACAKCKTFRKAGCYNVCANSSSMQCYTDGEAAEFVSILERKFGEEE